MPAPTLLSIATRTAIKYIDSITEMAGMPFKLAEPILKKVTNATQLHTLVETSPQLAEHTAERWTFLIKRDCPHVARNPHVIMAPDDPCDWYSVYHMHLKFEREREAAAEATLREQMLGNQAKKVENATVFVPEVMHHARDEKETNIFVDGVLNKRHSSDRPSSSTNVSRAKDGRSAIAAIRKQSANRHQQQRIAINKLDSSTLLAQNRRQIQQAPQSMIRTPALPRHTPKPLTYHERLAQKERDRAKLFVKIQAPGQVCNVKFAAKHEHENNAAIRRAQKANEAKLMDIKNQKKAVTIEAPRPITFKTDPTRFDQAEAVLDSVHSPTRPRADSLPAARSSPTRIVKRRHEANIFAPKKIIRR